MEPVITLLTCAFASFCAPDGACTARAPLTVTVDLGADETSIVLWTTPGATGRPTAVELLQPWPSQIGDPLHLLARTPRDGALLLSLVGDARTPTNTRATLRRTADRRGNPTGPGAEISQTTCTQSFTSP